jgi:DNA polymerase elongation subunit (family B)
MSKEEIKAFLTANRGYLKWGKSKLASKFKSNEETIGEIVFDINNTRGKEFKRLFFDIETSYNIVKAWRAGYNLNINPGDIIHERAVICVSWKWADEDKVYNLRWDENQCDKTLLKEFTKVLLEADEVIAHNGDRFDIKWLRTRCLIHRLPFPTYVKSLDTLKKVKSMFNFQSNKLDYIAEVLGFGNKLPTGMQLWDRIILKKEEKAMKEMLEYCNHDVVLLEDVYNTIFPYIKPDTHVGVQRGGNKHDCPSCGNSHVKYLNNTTTATTAKGNIQRHMECNSCKSDFIISNREFKKYLKEKN